MLDAVDGALTKLLAVAVASIVLIKIESLLFLIFVAMVVISLPPSWISIYHIFVSLPLALRVYTTDDERKMSFELAQDFGIKVQNIYSEYGYTLINAPCVSPEERVQFIIERLN